ncbi:class E sortase [Marmoricola sp. URHA0025 HA25]
MSDVDESEAAAEDVVPSRGKRARRKPAPADTTPDAKQGTGRRVTFWIGIGLMLAGLGMLGYVAWQFWGTNWVARKHQHELTSQIQQDWAGGHGCEKFCPKGATIALIRIPKFGKKYVIPVLEGTDKATVLDKGAFGHFEDTAEAGQVGNFALAGHRVTHGEPLRHMPDLRPGDKVIVETRKSTFTYVLDTNPNDLVISFTGVWVLDPLPHNPDPGGPEPAQVPGQSLITLTTCSEIFHTDNRMIAFGHLVKTVAKSVSAGQGSAS